MTAQCVMRNAPPYPPFAFLVVLSISPVMVSEMPGPFVALFRAKSLKENQHNLLTPSGKHAYAYAILPACICLNSAPLVAVLLLRYRHFALKLNWAHLPFSKNQNRSLFGKITYIDFALLPTCLWRIHSPHEVAEERQWRKLSETLAQSMPLVAEIHRAGKSRTEIMIALLQAEI